MATDIFISYSRKDSTQALGLAERLRGKGMSVWIDQHGLQASTQWSKEIVEAIEHCTAFVIMLSRDSIVSKSVIRELALASESGKTIIPLDVEPVAIPSELRYQLAGIQRAQFTDFDALIRSLERLGVTGNVSQTEVRPATVIADARKSLMVLPFEDLSPTNDNQWFADGLMAELITSLSNIKSLRLIDERTSREMRGVKLAIAEIAKDFSVRYFLHGSVRKFGEQIKISMSLLDVETNEHLWTDSHRGEFSDIFDIQEEVARKVIEGLKLHLSKEEEKKIMGKGTENAEAYELFLKASEIVEHRTRDAREKGLQLLTNAIELDPAFADAYKLKGFVLSELYRLNVKNPAFLDQAEAAALKVRELNPEKYSILYVLGGIYRQRGQSELAEQAAMEYVAKAPNDPMSHFALGFTHFLGGKYLEAVDAYKQVIRLEPDSRVAYWNLFDVLQRVGRDADARHWAERALPYFERFLKFHPDHHHIRVQYAVLLQYVGKREMMLDVIKPLEGVSDLDGGVLCNMACMYARIGHKEQAIESLRKAAAAGFEVLSIIKNDEDFESLREMTEYHELVQSLEVAEVPKTDEVL